MDKKKRDKAKTHYLVHKKFSINANFKSRSCKEDIARKAFKVKMNN